jgi:hypothetical protein
MSDDSNWKDADGFCKGAFGPFVSNVSQYTEIVAELMQHATDRERKRSADEIERLTAEAKSYRDAIEWMRARDDRNGSLPEAYREKIDEALGGLMP